MRRRLPILVLLVSVVIGLAVAGALPRLMPGVAYLDLQISPSASIRGREKVVLITIRRETFDRLGVESNGGALPRGQYATLLQLMRAAGAKVVAFDILFSQKTHEDELLRRELSKRGPMGVVLLVENLRDEMRDNDESEFRVLRPTVLPFLRPPNVRLAQAQTWDPDGVVRGIKLFLEDREVEGGIYPHISAAALAASEGEDVSQSESGLKAGVHFWDAGEHAELRLRWGSATSEIEYSDAVGRLKRGDNAPFRNAIVIVGATNQGQRLDDMHPTPTGDRSGGDVIAQAIQTLSQPSSEQIRTVPQSVQAIVAVGIALIAGAFGLRPSYLATLGAVGACTLGVYIVDRFLLDASSFAASTTYSASAGLVAMTITSVFAGVRHLPAWRRFRWKHGEQELAALFIDVEDSTSALGRLQGRDREFLEDIQARIARIVDRNGGHIERTMGDGAFAVFREGTPVQRAERCLSTMTLLAHVFHKEAAGYRKRFGIAPILVLGAEMATVESAVLASRGREEFTTLGRDIAFAQRVQSAAKSFDHRAAIGPRLRTLLTDWTCLGETQELALKGFDGLHPVTEALVTIQGTLDAAPLP